MLCPVLSLAGGPLLFSFATCSGTLVFLPIDRDSCDDAHGRTVRLVACQSYPFSVFVEAHVLFCGWAVEGQIGSELLVDARDVVTAIWCGKRQ